MSCKFRSLTAYDPRIRVGMRCPVCWRIGWVQDGVSVVERADEGILVEGLDAARPQRAEWHCMACGYAADESSRMSRLLARALIGSRFADLG